MHHPGPQTGQLEHLVVADPVDLAGLGHDPRVGRVDAIDVGIDLAAVGPQHGGECHRRRVGAAPAQRRDVVVLVDTLKAGHDHDLALAQRLGHPLGRDVPDPGLGVKAVGHQSDLGAREADRRHAQALDGHRHQGDADLLAGREQHVHLAGGRVFGDLLGQRDQFVGRVPAGRDDDQNLIAALMGLDRPPRRRQDLVGIRDAGPTKFLNEQRHVDRSRECER